MPHGSDDDHRAPVAAGPSADRTASYTLRRLAARRTVRAAVALARLPKGPAAAREAWRSPLTLDDPGPDAGRHLREPHLRVAHLSAVPLTDATAPGIRLRADRWRTQVEGRRPDAVLLDVLAPWLDAGTVTELRTLTDAPLLATAEVAARLPGATFDLVIDPEDPDGPGAPCVDHRADSPVGTPLDPTDVVAWSPGRPLPAEVAGAVVVTEVGADDRAAVAGALRLAARGTVVVSVDGGRVAHTLGPTAVTASAADLAARAAALVADRDDRERRSVAQRRHVLAAHTIDDRARQLLASAGVRLRPPPRATVLLATRRPEQVAPTLATVAGQRWDDLEIQLLLHGFEVDATALDARGRRLEVHQHVPAELPLGAVLDRGLDAATGEVVAKMDDDDLYGAGHLADLAVALRYSGADVVGRWANITHLVDEDLTVDPHRDRQERWAHHLPGATMLVHGTVLRRLRWRHVPHGVDRQLIEALYADGGQAYATHRFGFVRRRHGDHTFTKDDRAFAREGATTRGLDRSLLDV